MMRPRVVDRIEPPCPRSPTDVSTTTLRTYPSMRGSTFLYGLVLTMNAILFTSSLNESDSITWFNEDVSAEMIPRGLGADLRRRRRELRTAEASRSRPYN
jgi:hypothetical protein